MRGVYVLPFEKPVVDLITRVKELRELAKSDQRLNTELRRLEDKAGGLIAPMVGFVGHDKAELAHEHPRDRPDSPCRRT